MIVLGIDPGVTGGWAVVSSTGDLLAVGDITNDGNGRVATAPLIAELYQVFEAHPVARAIVEDVHSMPKQGVSTGFKFGRAAGVAETIPIALGVGVELIAPSTWKRTMGMPKGDKDGARQEAMRRWPTQHELFSKPKAKGQARADAAFIALAWLHRLPKGITA
jgi:crossover junction endodeoxyribonuclease RuvC